MRVKAIYFSEMNSSNTFVQKEERPPKCKVATFLQHYLSRVNSGAD